MKKTILLLIFFFSALNGYVSAQQTFIYPKIGDRLKNHVFYDVMNFNSLPLETDSMQGKWLILDVWGYSCGKCINSFPKMDTLSKKFKDHVNIIMVGSTKTRGKNRLSVKEQEDVEKDIYRRVSLKSPLSIPVSYDSVFYEKYVVEGVPHILVVDPSGIIRAKMTTIDSIQLSEFINGKMPKYTYSYSHNESRMNESYNEELPYLTSGREVNGGIDTVFLYRSLLAIADQRTPIKVSDLFEKRIVNKQSPDASERLEFLNVELKSLYMSAYFGKNSWVSSDSIAYGNWWQDIVFGGSRPKEFLDNFHLFNYSLKVPKHKSNRATYMRIMQGDLKNYFGFNAHLERRNMPIYILEITDRQKVNHFFNDTLKTQFAFKGGISFNKRLFSDFFDIIATNYRYKENAVIINNTNIKGKVSFNFKADFLDSDDIERSLNNNGFILRRDKKEMSVLVITDESNCQSLKRELINIK